MNISQVGLDIIKRNEGCRLTAYRDVIGVLTIGWGHTGPDVREGLTITQAEADQMLSDRLAREFEPSVNQAILHTPTTQAQFDAMVSLSYNIGVGAFLKSSVLRRHKVRDYTAAGGAFLLWNRAGGLVLKGLSRRRAEERKLYLSSISVNPVDLQKDVTTRPRGNR